MGRANIVLGSAGLGGALLMNTATVLMSYNKRGRVGVKDCTCSTRFLGSRNVRCARLMSTSKGSGIVIVPT